ncbi:unnamed protein product, partial [Ixodes pacificus]
MPPSPGRRSPTARPGHGHPVPTPCSNPSPRPNPARPLRRAHCQAPGGASLRGTRKCPGASVGPRIVSGAPVSGFGRVGNPGARPMSAGRSLPVSVPSRYPEGTRASGMAQPRNHVVPLLRPGISGPSSVSFLELWKFRISSSGV